jgi:Rrf2 family protein
MKLSRTVAYAVHAVIQLAGAGDGVPISSSHLARQGHLPERFLVQILRCLVTRGLLNSRIGSSGGYSLSRPPAELTLLDIVESFGSQPEDQIPNLECLSQEVRRRVSTTFYEAAAAARAKLQQLSLTDLLLASSHQTQPVPGHVTPPIELTFPPTSANECETPTRDPAIIH